jgi:two-component system, OmpR family, sensor kinase
VSIRRRLVLGILLMSAAGLIGLSLVTIQLLRQSLLTQKDAQVSSLSERVARSPNGSGVFEGPNGSNRRGPGSAPSESPTAFFQSIYASTGEYLRTVNRSQADTGGGLPADFDVLRAKKTLPFTTDAVKDSRYRVVVRPVVFTDSNGDPIDDGFLVTGIDIRDVDVTTSRLVHNEVLAIGIGLALMGFMTWFIVRTGLKPLNHMADTAGAIAAGDLSARVDTADGGTEVGRLGGALNTMLGRIEAAFAERAKSEEKLRRFVADASHELRTPLTSIRGYSELLRNGAIPSGDETHSALGRIESEAVRMGVLVDDLLLLARLDQGRPLEYHPIDLTTIVRDAVNDARITDPDRVWMLDTIPQALVSGDESRLRQVVGNLLTNARTHTTAGTPVDVSVAMADGQVELVVADHGAGVPPGEEKRIFERFARLDGSRQRASGGTGLGLAIVNAIAWSHGGAVGVRQTEGGGASFWLRLPPLGSATWPAPGADVDEPATPDASVS